MEQWLVNGTESRIEQCWVAHWYLWCSEGVRDQLARKSEGMASLLGSEIEFNEWVDWYEVKVPSVPLQNGK